MERKTIIGLIIGVVAVLGVIAGIVVKKNLDNYEEDYYE